jgi:tetratricopeptide (TPR) repeat protein
MFFRMFVASKVKYMTVSEATQLYNRILNHVLEFSMKDAFSGLGYLIQQNNFGKAYDKLTETENKYRYMLRYRLEGFPDPDREKVENGIRRQLLELAGEAFHIWMTRNSPDFYYDRIRVDRVTGSEPLIQCIETMRHAGDRLTIVDLVDESADKDVQTAQLVRLRENAVGQTFMKIFISESWTDEDRIFLNNVLMDPAFFEYEKALFVSAILLSLQKRFDFLKIIFLIDQCIHADMEVSQRSLVALVLTLYLYDARLSLYPEIGLRLASLLDERPDLQESFVRVFYQLIRSKETDKVTKRMQEEILPEMTKMGSALQDKLREGEDISDEFNPDWKNMMENAEFSVKMQQFSDMQLEGIDVYMSTFSTQKAYSFFMDFFNWFMPFYPSHSSLKDLFGSSSLEGSSILEAVVKSDYLCSSDKFSFCFNILQVPASYRATMSAQMNAESEAYEEIKKSNIGMNSKFRLELASNRYIQDLYRFFNLQTRKKDFINPFSLPLDFHNTLSLGMLVRTEEPLRRIAMLYFKNKHFGHALMVIDRLLALCPAEAELHQKRGFCLQQLDQPKLALTAYLQADLIRPDSLWTLKRIATTYRQLKNPEKAVDYYKRAETLAPDDISLTLNLGHALLEAKEYSEALNVYFKAEVLSEGSDKTYRPIAWCSFMCRKYEQADKYYAKMLDLNPTLEDFLNAGHVEWCKGFPMKAIDLYKRGIHLTHTILPDFLELFRKDSDELLRHGISQADISALRDELIYELEE